MDALDDAVLLGPDSNEEAQHWIEAANNRTKSRPPATDEQELLRNTDEPSASTQRPAASKSPPSPRTTNESTRLQEDRNTFEESFTRALTHLPMSYDGPFDHHEDDYDEQTPLLNSYYKAPHSPHPAVFQPSHHAPLEPPSKTRPSRSICLWNQVSHNSQYTRPAAEILREVLEVRYPVASSPAGYEQLGEPQGPSRGNEVRGRRRWWNRLLRRRVTG